MIEWFFQILGGVCLGVVFVLIVLFFILKKKFKAYAENMEIIGEAETIEVHLEQLELPQWRNAKEVHRFGHELQGAGFTEIGSFLPKELAKSTLINAWIKEEDHLFAVIYDHKVAGVWVDLVADLEGGTQLTVSNSSREMTVQLPPNCEIILEKKASIAELLEQLNKRLEGETFLCLEAEDFVHYFETNYRESKLWNLLRLGPSEEEVRATIALMGKEVTDEQVQEVIQIQREHCLENLYNLCVKAFLDSEQVSASRWEEIRERIIVVHDKFSEAETIACYHRLEPTDKGVVEKLKGGEKALGFSPRSFFGELVQGNQGKFHFEFVDSVSFPLPADIYIGPNDDGDDEEENRDSEG